MRDEGRGGNTSEVEYNGRESRNQTWKERMLDKCWMNKKDICSLWQEHMQSKSNRPVASFIFGLVQHYQIMSAILPSFMHSFKSEQTSPTGPLQALSQCQEQAGMTQIPVVSQQHLPPGRPLVWGKQPLMQGFTGKVGFRFFVSALNIAAQK